MQERQGARIHLDVPRSSGHLQKVHAIGGVRDGVGQCTRAPDLHVHNVSIFNCVWPQGYETVEETGSDVCMQRGIGTARQHQEYNAAPVL
jgi:hypothetical protein